MKVLFLTTSTNDTDQMINSLKYLNRHDVDVFRYDQRWTQEFAAAHNRDRALRGNGHVELADLPVERVNCGADILEYLPKCKPDVVLYISSWGGRFVLSNEVLGTINAQAPLVHMLFDGGDPPWWPQLAQFEKEGIFSLTVNIDGNHVWPGGKDWQLSDSVSRSVWTRATEDLRISNGISKALTLLTPISPDFYPPQTLRFSERPYPIGYCGNVGGFMRKGVVDRMQWEQLPFIQRERAGTDPTPVDSYKAYADFLRHCRIVVNVPFTGSGVTTHVKGRVLEAGHANTCLLEWKNLATRSWFTPRFEFAEYESIEELIDQCRYLSSHVSMCEEIADALHRKVRTEHSPESFWGQVFSKLGLDVEKEA